MPDGLNANQVAQTPLTLRIADGNILSTLGTFSFEAQVVKLIANATNYVWLDLTQTPPQIAQNTTGFPSTASYQIAVAVTNASIITSLTDSRPSFNTKAYGNGTTRALQFLLNGAGSTPNTGVFAQISMPYACTIKGWVITADQSGSAVVDILRSTFSAFPTTASIAGTDKPTLSSAQKNEDLALSGWGSTAINAGDILQANLNSVSTVTQVFVTLNITVP